MPEIIGPAAERPRQRKHLKNNRIFRNGLRTSQPIKRFHPFVKADWKQMSAYYVL
jgi:hypothetical protein